MEAEALESGFFYLEAFTGSFFFFFINLFYFYLFIIFGCVGSLLLHAGFL